MHADVLITIVFGGFVAFAALVTVFVLLRARLEARSAGREGEEEQPVAPVH